MKTLLLTLSLLFILAGCASSNSSAMFDQSHESFNDITNGY